MTAIVTVIGIIGLVVVVIDLFVTVLQPGTEGFLAYRITDAVWSGARRLHRRAPHHHLLASIGVALVAVLPLIWLGLMWFFWSLIFLVNQNSVVRATTELPSDGWAKVYFAGYSLFTSGLGDHIPGSSVWQIVTVISTAMGLGLVTLAVTFLVPILQAANARRACARSIGRLGLTLDRIVDNLDLVEASASSIAATFVSVAEQHTAYPMLDHLHTLTADNALSVQLDHLDRALRVSGEDGVELRLLRCALDDLVDAITPGADRAATPERLARLREANGWSAPVETS